METGEEATRPESFMGKVKGRRISLSPGLSHDHAIMFM
jgi:hypothetical protein